MNPVEQAIYKPPEPVDDQAPFKGDLFARKELGDRLKNHIARLPSGAVFAIEAPWGEGKTWFATNWAADLRRDGFRVLYVDAFKSDYVEDPFVLLTAELVESLGKTDGDGTDGLAAAGRRVGRALLPIAARVAAGVAGRLILGSAEAYANIKDAVDDAIDGAEDAAERALEKRLDDYAADKSSVQHFRDELTQVAQQSPTPIIVMIDELDRCRPSFAVQMLERIKHFFEVPNVVFVLFLNRSQLIESVRGMYGAGLDADAYLRKFLQFTLSLPKTRARTDDQSRSFNVRICEATLTRYGFPRNEYVESFANTLALVGDLFGFSLRDMERGATLFSLGQPIQTGAPIAAWLTALKLARPEIFLGILRGEPSAHAEAKKLAAEFKSRSPDFWVALGLPELHEAAVDPEHMLSGNEAQFLYRAMGNIRSASRGMVLVARKLDLAISD